MGLRHMLAQLLRREPVIWSAPPIPAGALCRRCGAPATEQWCPSVCALADEPKEWVSVCTECDIELNEHTVRFFYGDTKDAVLAQYASERRALPAPDKDSDNGR